jgi:site-specific DNA recombinase
MRRVCVFAPIVHFFPGARKHLPSGKTEQVAKGVMLRPPRGRSGMARREKSSAKRKPSSEWLFIPVPAIVSEEVFASAQDQLKRKFVSARAIVEQGATSCRG